MDPEQRPRSYGRELTAATGEPGIQAKNLIARTARRLTLWNSSAPQPSDNYIKGDFKGLVCAKFGSQTERGQAVEIMHTSTAGNKQAWAKPDFPLD
eukprot:8125602-Pyramimonas_sp.AAC.3